MKFARIKNRIRKYWLQLLMEKTSARSVALSFAVGTFIAILPTPGFGIFVALFVAYLFKNLNNLSIVASFAVWNPLILAPIYILSYKIGNSIFHTTSIIQTNLDWLNKTLVFLQSYLFGNIISATVFSIVSYIFIYYLIKSYKKRKIIKRGSRKIIVPEQQIKAA